MATDGNFVMIVDDDVAIREVVQVIVEAEGYQVITAADGGEAISHLQSGPHPGLILLDLRMPGMDGRTFREVQKARAELASIPVVILTGDRDGAQIAAALQTEYIGKPIDLQQLLSVVNRFCSGPERRPPHP